MKSNLVLIIFLCLINFISLKISTNTNLRHEEPILGMSEIEFTSNNDYFELKGENVISQISWTKSGDYKYNYLLGIFEGANDPSFKDAVPLAMIKGEIKVVNYIDINTTNT
jgi:hypothetical protein